MKLTLKRPDDWHLHLRDGAYLYTTVPHTARQFTRAIVMPNLSPPVTTAAQAMAYRERILAAAGTMRFEPLMTLYLTDNTPPDEIQRAADSKMIKAVKLYPAGATTNSAAGVTDITRTYATLAAMEEAGMPLLVHGEVTNPSIDIFDRETVFIDKILIPLTARFPRLKIVFEHITTRTAVDYVLAAPGNIAATITAHHLLMNRNHMLAGGIRPHHYCLPVLKRETDRTALLKAATSGNPKFFLGTDSAPHAQTTKEAACGCAGIYTAHAAIEFYAEAFAQAGALYRLEAFASFHGADFYGLPRNTDAITLSDEEQAIPENFAFGDERLIPFRAGGSVGWRVL